MKCGMIPQLIFFAAVLAELTGTPCIQVKEKNACHPLVKVSWSSTTREYPPGHNVTMFCKVSIGNGTLTNSTEVEWSVQPHRSLQKNVSFQRQVSDDGKKINARLTLRNITKNDSSLYSITFCNMCGSVSCQTSLKVRDTCSYKRPDPVQKEITINVSQDVSTLKLAANFTGATDQTHWLVIWSNSSTSGLGFLGGKYRTEHRVVSHCFFTEELNIHNVSINDAGWYFAKVYDSMDTGVNTTFHVNIMNHEDHKKKKYAFVAFLSVGILSAVGVISIVTYLRLYQKQKPRQREPLRTHWIHNPLISSEMEEEQEEANYVFHTKNSQLAALSGHNRVFFLYHKTDVSDKSLVNMADILDKRGISSCLDITTETIPANWRLWTEEKIDSCDHVIHVCTRPLYRALRENINDTDNDVVKMFKGEFSACTVVNCVRAPKFIPVFLDHTPDENVVPTQLRTHHFFHLRVRELMQAVEEKPMEYEEKEINNNPLFRDIKKLIDLLQ